MAVTVYWHCVYSFEEEHSRKWRGRTMPSLRPVSLIASRWRKRASDNMPHVSVATKSASLFKYYRIKCIPLDSLKPYNNAMQWTRYKYGTLKKNNNINISIAGLLTAPTTLRNTLPRKHNGQMFRSPLFRFILTQITMTKTDMHK